MYEHQLLRIWAKHVDVLPDFESFRSQRLGAWSCPGCLRVYTSNADWRGKTELVELQQLIPGGRTWERRRCKCGNTRSLPRGGSHA